MYIKENDILIKFIDKDTEELIAVASINDATARSKAIFIERMLLKGNRLGNLTKPEKVLYACFRAGVYVGASEDKEFIKSIIPNIPEMISFTYDYYRGVVEFSKQRMDIGIKMKPDNPVGRIFV